MLIFRYYYSIIDLQFTNIFIKALNPKYLDYQFIPVICSLLCSKVVASITRDRINFMFIINYETETVKYLFNKSVLFSTLYLKLITSGVHNAKLYL